MKDGGSIFIFPEGTRSRSGTMIKAKKGFILLAKMTKVPISPIGLEGTEKLLPINSDSMSKEHFYHSKVKVTCGEPLIYQKKNEDNKGNWTDLAADYSMKKIAEHIVVYIFKGMM